MLTLPFDLLRVRELLVDLLLHVFSRNQLKIHPSLLLLARRGSVLDEEHKVFDSEIVFELDCNLPGAGKQLQGLQLGEVLHGLDLAGRAYEHVAISDWLAVHHGEYVATGNEDMLLRDLLASEEQRLQDGLVHHGILLRHLYIVACNLLRKSGFTPESLVFVHRLVRRGGFRRLRAAPSEKAHR